ncbi:class I SAM-dependent methyltransferase [Marinitenerispora sediminis]|uniref:SAM-dependent methyltransferase n=1 Tax=Marinitenerispora sediminis TaxID=1931232 RepID=A0A368T0H7_9ACTN|nr:class I SAM-dependent methyltransferase [Marinitenerispora sediminis]RCV48806.1 SAM-dependent methyltransferase [Marinitenerispora sediminis]RCV49964.1 SAM-dependent methyltransferase [Marinitenerispora sediminis]RCV52879.1 SAM-dependent methyltransferase [Marinitenerispora sediminis]
MTSGQIAAFHALLTPAGQHLLAEADAAELHADPLAAATRLRRAALEGPDPAAAPAGGQPVEPAQLVNAALTQARLRGRAREKFGAAADRMYFTPAGLEQATRGAVARYRAHRFAAAAAVPDGATVGDLCCGIGADLLALARAGLPVEGVDLDPLTVAVATANVEALGLGAAARVREGDAARTPPGRYAAVLCDPARRGRRGRIFDPDAYAPPWRTVLDLARGAAAACVKAAPGLPHELVPEDAAAEWISVDGEVKETALWFGPLRGAPRQATLLRGSAPAGTADAAGPPDRATLVADPGLGDPPLAAPGRYLYEPDGAVVRAHLVAEAAAEVGGALLDPHIAYITADRLVPTPFCRAYEVLDVLPFSLKRLRAVLRERRVGIVTIKKRGSAVDVERLRRDLRLSGPNALVVVLTRVGDRPICLLCSEVSAP